MSERTVFRTCPLCEATCGLKITLDGDTVTDIRGDDDDVFSHGYICPKGTTLGSLHEDPDRVREPLIKRGGVFTTATWEEAFAEIERRLLPILQANRDAVAVYVGNPNAHNLDSLLYLKPLIKALGSKNIYSASTMDQRPKELQSALMFGTPLTIPIPDIDHTMYLLMLGANPYESNGSLATAADWPGKMKGIQQRGGKVIVVDPRRTRTAGHADAHLAIRPGTDALLLAAIANTIFAGGRIDLGACEGIIDNLDVARQAVEPFTPETVASQTGIDAATIRQIANEICDAESAAVYGRMGTTTQQFGTTSSWLVDLINIISGNLDRRGGAMFPMAAAGGSNTRGTPRIGKGVRPARFVSRVRGLPETFGELPVAALGEEIDTPGDGQIKALITVAGNPALSAPDAGRLDRAMSTLDFMVSVDIYLNETTRHADVILPPPSALQRGHYDLAFMQITVRNAANYSPPAIPKDDDQPAEWEILSKLALIAQGAGASADPQIADDFIAQTLADASVRDPGSMLHGKDVSGLMSARKGPERLLDLLLHAGPYDITLEDLEKHPHGIDLGPLQPRLPDVLRTPTGMIDAAPKPCVDDMARLLAVRDVPVNDGLMLVGRRHLRTNNSWLHNIPAMVKGKNRSSLQMHPDDALLAGVKDGERVTVASASGSVIADVHVTDEVRPGVVSLPHGWGHDVQGSGLSVAGKNPGVNTNILTDPAVDPVSGNAVLNGIPVTVTPV